jgi:4-hydroxy-tetrahydrodipicolinate reductase
MPIRIIVAGATGWTGSAITRAILASGEFTLVGAVARSQAGADVGVALGLPPNGVALSATLADALQAPTDVVIDFTHHDAVMAHTLTALQRGARVIIGTSGLAAADYAEIERVATERGLGVIAAGNFSITAALAKRFALIAAKYVPSWEIIDYANAAKADAPSGTTRELAEDLSRVAIPLEGMPLDRMHGPAEARGASIAGTRVHSLRLPGYVIGFETIFGLPDERLTIRHDAGAGAEPYIGGALLAAHRVMGVVGLVRGLDRLLFED